MKKFFCFILLAAFTLQLGRAESMKKTVFPNGLKLLYKYTPNNAVVAIDLFVSKGSAAEDSNFSGITNFVQTLLSKGTTHRSAEQIAKEIETVGGILSSSSAEDYAESYAVVTQNHFVLGMELLADICLFPDFPEQEISKEREAILAAIKSREEDILTVTEIIFNQNFYGRHPYARPSFGIKETVKNIQRKDLVEWHQKLYQPQQIILVVVGNIPFNRVKKITEKCFGGLKQSKPAGFIQPGDLSLRTLPTVVSEKRKFEQACLMIGYQVPPVTHPDYLALKLLNTLLGRGMSSLLFQELREKNGLGYEVASFYPSRLGPSKFVIYIGLDRKNLNFAKEKILTLIGNLTKEIVSQGDRIEAAKNYLRGDYLLDHQTNKRQAWYLGWWEILGMGWQYDQIYPEKIKTVAAFDLVKVLRKYFRQNYLQVEVVPPK